MKYTEEEVLDIIRTLTDKDPVEVFALGLIIKKLINY